jgi:hypothetical protein
LYNFLLLVFILASLCAMLWWVLFFNLCNLYMYDSCMVICSVLLILIFFNLGDFVTLYHWLWLYCM